MKGVSISERTDHLCNIELCHILRKSILKLGEEGQEVSATVVVHHQILDEKGLAMVVMKRGVLVVVVAVVMVVVVVVVVWGGDKCKRPFL